MNRLNRQSQVMIEKSRTREQKESELKKEAANRFDTQLKKALDLSKTAFASMPTVAADLASYFEGIERTFLLLHIEEDIKLHIINNRLTDDARKLIAKKP